MSMYFHNVWCESTKKIVLFTEFDDSEAKCKEKKELHSVMMKQDQDTPANKTTTTTTTVVPDQANKYKCRTYLFGQSVIK